MVSRKIDCFYIANRNSKRIDFYKTDGVSIELAASISGDDLHSGFPNSDKELKIS
jgi:hypothetical protein